VYNRDGLRLGNLLSSLLVHQDVKPAEVIVVDTSDETTIVEMIQTTVGRFDAARLVHYRAPDFNLSRSYNVGIKTTSEGSRYVMTTDMDFVFSPNFVHEVLKRLEGDRSFVMTCAGMLEQNADLSNFHERWSQLKQQARSGVHYDFNTPGACQAATRAWWFRIRGYDERFVDVLGNEDNDVWMRAKQDGLEVKWIRFAEAQALHQWHPVSPLKGRSTSHLFTGRPPVVKNEKGWGRRCTESA